MKTFLPEIVGKIKAASECFRKIKNRCDAIYEHLLKPSVSQPSTSVRKCSKLKRIRNNFTPALKELSSLSPAFPFDIPWPNRLRNSSPTRFPYEAAPSVGGR